MSRGYIDRPLALTDSSTFEFSTRRRSLAEKHNHNTFTTMSSPQSTNNDRTTQPYLLVPNLHIADPSAREVDLGSHPWMIATVIEDDDLTFGGKPLSTWYEEDRRRLSTGDEEEERRGRQRERVRVSSHHHHHCHLKQQPQQQYCQKPIEAKQ